MPHGRWLALVLALCAAAAPAARAQDLRSQLEQLHSGGLWGEALLADGSVVTVRVDSLWADTVAVHQAIGPLQEQPCVLSLARVQSVRPLGPHRVPPTEGVHRSTRSVVGALVLEAAVPGAGYAYAGQPRTGLVLLGLGAAVVGAAVLTGQDGAAAWVPAAAWLKVAALLNLRDEVLAMQGSAREGGDGSGGHDATPTQGRLLRHLQLGVLAGQRGPVPALQLRLAAP